MSADPQQRLHELAGVVQPDPPRHDTRPALVSGLLLPAAPPT